MRRERDRLAAACAQLQTERLHLQSQASRAQAQADDAVVHACVVEMFAAVRRRVDLQSSLVLRQQLRTQQQLQAASQSSPGLHGSRPPLVPVPAPGARPARASDAGVQCALVQACPLPAPGSGQKPARQLSWQQQEDRSFRWVLCKPL